MNTGEACNEDTLNKDDNSSTQRSPVLQALSEHFKRWPGASVEAGSSTVASPSQATFVGLERIP